MMKIVTLLTVTAVALLAWTAGCALMGPGYVEPAEYDLADPPEEARPMAAMVRFGVFRNVSGADRRFLIRAENDRMLTDEYNRWLVSPELLIERRLRAAMPDPAEIRRSGETVRLSGTVYRFELNRKRKLAVVGVDYSARLPGGASLERSTLCEAPLRDDSPASAVRAMSLAVEKSTAAAKLLVTELLRNEAESAKASPEEKQN